jgi:hypothetical protein
MLMDCRAKTRRVANQSRARAAGGLVERKLGGARLLNGGPRGRLAGIGLDVMVARESTGAVAPTARGDAELRWLFCVIDQNRSGCPGTGNPHYNARFVPKVPVGCGAVSGLRLQRDLGAVRIEHFATP